MYPRLSGGQPIIVVTKDFVVRRGIQCRKRFVTFAYRLQAVDQPGRPDAPALAGQFCLQCIDYSIGDGFILTAGQFSCQTMRIRMFDIEWQFSAFCLIVFLLYLLMKFPNLAIGGHRGLGHRLANALYRRVFQAGV